MTALAAPPRPGRLPAGPLLALLDLHGGPVALGVQRDSREDRAIKRARAEGSVTERAADLLAVHVLHRTPWEVWGATYGR